LYLPNLKWTWRVIAFDERSQSRTSTSAFRYETYGNTPPTIPDITLPTNNTIKLFNDINFTWTASTETDNDNILYDLLVAKDPDFTNIDLNRTGIINNHLDLKENASTLSGDTRYWKVRAYDGTDYSNYSNYLNLKVIVAVLNITVPANNTRFYPTNTTEITITEFNNTAWILNVTIEINNTNYTPSNTGDTWTVNVTFSSLTAQNLDITAIGYNETDNLTATTIRTIIFSKVSSTPEIDYICSNETYSLNNTNVTIKLKSNLDTLINTTNVTITLPSGIKVDLNVTSFTKDNLVYIHNHLYSLNETGNYTLNATIKDIEGKTINKSSVFYATTKTKTISVSGINLTNINFNDVCTGNVITDGTAIVSTIPENALFNVEVNTVEPKIIFNNLNLTNTTILLNYTDLARNISAPSEQRILTEFEIKSNLTNYDSITISYNYTSVEEILDDETGLRMYKCADQVSCGSSEWTRLTVTLNTTTNIISTVVTDLSVFLVSETATTTTTETVTVTETITAAAGGGGGGGSVVTRIASLDAIVPSPISLHQKDTITVPIILKNRGEVELNDIDLTYEVNVEGITIDIVDTHFESLDSDETVSTNIIITTDLQEFDKNEIIITATVNSPKLTESVDLIIETIDIFEGNRTLVEEKLKFTSDVFEQNPECLELKELLTTAQQSLENKEFQKSLSLIESALNACKQLVGETGLRTIVARPSGITGFKITVPLIITAIIIALALILYGARNTKWKLPKLNLKLRSKKKHKRRIGPTKKELGTFESEEKKIKRMLRGRGL